jgi:hypothetical protein
MSVTRPEIVNAHLVRVTTDCGDAFDPKVKRRGGETGSLKERHNKTAKAAVYMEADTVLQSELA